MIQGSFILLAAAAFLAVAEGRREEGLWRYRGIRRILRECRKKGIKIPEWLEEKMILRTWLLLFLGSTFLNIWGIAEMFAGDGQVTRLKRPEFGQGTVQEELNLEWEEEDGTRGVKKCLWK